MAVLKIKLNNILCFNDFEADFSYPKKIVNNPLEYEYLKDYPKLRYKKVNILIGSNATGKTSLGRAIWMTFRFLSNKEGDRLKELVSNPNKEAHILMDYVFSNGKFFRLEVKILTTGEILTRYIPIVICIKLPFLSIFETLAINIFPASISLAKTALSFLGT